jgi:hypothetical protein
MSFRVAVQENYARLAGTKRNIFILVVFGFFGGVLFSLLGASDDRCVKLRALDIPVA